MVSVFSFKIIFSYLTTSVSSLKKTDSDYLQNVIFPQTKQTLCVIQLKKSQDNKGLTRSFSIFNKFDD